MALTFRVLDPEEWSRLSDTPMASALDNVSPINSSAQVMVIEDDGVIIASCIAAVYVGNEDGWIAPDYRDDGIAASMLHRGMNAFVRRMGAPGFLSLVKGTAAHADLARVGAVPLDGQLFFVPVRVDDADLLDALTAVRDVPFVLPDTGIVH